MVIGSPKFKIHAVERTRHHRVGTLALPTSHSTPPRTRKALLLYRI
jgi:hypothetical protein